MNRVIALQDNIVLETKFVKENYSLKENEIFSAYGELGQKMNEDGTFTTLEPTPVELQETLEQKIERLEMQIQQDNLITFEVLATIYEELLMKGSV